MSYVIKRVSDGRFYAGTADRNAVWTKDKDQAAHFDQPNLASRRLKSLMTKGGGPMAVSDG